MPLDSESYLVGQGWGGKGTALRQGSLVRPLAIPQKKTLAGLGKDRDEAFPFWDHLFSAAAKAITIKCVDTDDEGSASGSDDPSSSSGATNLKRTSTGIISNRRPVNGTPADSGCNTPDPDSTTNQHQPRMSLMAAAKREAARRGLYSRFFKGPILGPESVEEEQRKLERIVESAMGVDPGEGGKVRVKEHVEIEMGDGGRVVVDVEVEKEMGRKRKRREGEEGGEEEKSEKKRRKEERRREKDERRERRRGEEKGDEEKKEKKSKRKCDDEEKKSKRKHEKEEKKKSKRRDEGEEKKKSKKHSSEDVDSDDAVKKKKKERNGDEADSKKSKSKKTKHGESSTQDDVGKSKKKKRKHEDNDSDSS